jgi:serine/threonine-protein kinase RsbW
MSLVCIRSTEHAAHALDQVDDALVHEGFSSRDRFAVRLALEEALVNGLKHGNGNDPGKEVRCWWTVSPSGFKAVVEDEGPGFDRRRVPDCRADENLARPSGRGLLLMRSAMTWVRLNRRGNRVTLYKRRTTDDRSEGAQGTP